MINNRLYWTDEDWARHLGCPVEKVQKYREILDKHYVSCVEQDVKDGMYHFCLYYVDTNSTNPKKSRVFMSPGFPSERAVIDSANEKLISRLMLNTIQAKKLELPQQALQMLLVKNK